MRIGDAAPSAQLRATADPAAATKLQRTPGPAQRAYRERRPPALYEIPDRQERRRQIEAAAERSKRTVREPSEKPPRPTPAPAEGGGRGIETRQRVHAGAVPERADAYGELRRFAEGSNLDVGDYYGLVGNDVRVKQVLSTLGEFASGLAEGDPTQGRSVPRLGTGSAPANEAAGTVAAAATAPSDSNLGGFLASLASQQGRLQARAGLLEGVISALDPGPLPADESREARE